MNDIPPEFLTTDQLSGMFPEESRSDRLDRLLFTQTKAFQSVGISQEQFQVVEVPIGPQEWIHTIFVRSTNRKSDLVFYLTHGFAGTSLFFYEVAAKLRDYGDLVLLDLRGMGFSSKYCPDLRTAKEIIHYFVEPIERVRIHYNHEQFVWVSHSFGAYVAMLYTSFYPERVKRQVLLSPIGITPKSLDKNSSINTLGDFGSYLVNQLGWHFKLTYKTLLKYFALGCKKSALQRSFRDYGCPEVKVSVLADIVLQLYEEPLGSERIFFRLFEPRVLPTYDLIEHYKSRPCTTPTLLIYGETDWVDKKGGRQLAEKQSQVFQFKELKNISHQILFEEKEGLLDELVGLILGN